MAKDPIRRAQLIAPFGVGAMTVVQGGTGLIAAGLDHWYEREDVTSKVDTQEFEVEEWRLQRLLSVGGFRLPPDFRRNLLLGQDIPNQGLTIPFLRFPTWHFCPKCHRLFERPLTERSRPKCDHCKGKPSLYQVPFVAMCQQGHIQDFPWREWVHQTAQPTCQRDMRILATGSASLSGQVVRCDCGAQRYLTSITNAYPDGTTFLSKNLEPSGGDYLCRGEMPWLGNGHAYGCDQHLRGSLRSASNVYYAQVKSAIYIPRECETVPEGLVALFEVPPLSSLLSILDSVTVGQSQERWSKIVSGVRNVHGAMVSEYTDEQLVRCAQLILELPKETRGSHDDPPAEDAEIAFRREEFNVLRTRREESSLSVLQPEMKHYGIPVQDHIARVTLINRLRETRAFAGFTRVFADNSQTLAARKAMLRRDPTREDWLPAYVVHGEGIFVELEEVALSKWESRPEVVERIGRLDHNFRQAQSARRLQQIAVSPRFVLLHTLAHLIMNGLTYECGYSSAALRERIYVSDSATLPMAGLLIYTAAGDSEGTMGGLVRMGKPGNFEPVLLKCLRSALWCSADPICMEIGGSSGQGPEQCNLAACHNCALVPETACEHFNRFLDRATVVGDYTNALPGFFHVDLL